MFLKLYILLSHHCGVSTIAFKQLGERLQLKWLLFPPRKIHHQAKLAWSFKVWPSKFSKNSRGKFQKSFKINSTIAKLRVWRNCSHWIRLAWSHHQHFTTGYRTYAGVINIGYYCPNKPFSGGWAILYQTFFSFYALYIFNGAKILWFLSRTRQKKRREHSNGFSILIGCFHLFFPAC